ncbi:uncharacterized protein LOC113758040 [Coffea eugenioides]|uniref:uncharacterized protein LOC113758040 n=1 Tax=Coffea eugenioides TaxID=49369 RepID=UPI000F6141C5|nr:uncharacterized protein LOC113758040 [Coffea eugenioides]
MAALLHGEAPPFVRPSKTFASLLSQAPSSSSSGIGHLSTYKGEPSLVISRQDMMQIAAPYSNALVGRFAIGRPSIELIRKFIVSLGLRGECPIGLLDSKHILLRPSEEEDYTRLWCRRSWYVGKFHMSLSKWTIDFKPGVESSIAPVWVNFPGLPLPFFEKQFLLKLGTLLGRPLKVDEATASLKRPSVARILLEIDVLQSPKSRIWIGDDQWGFWQKIEYKGYPAYCGFCSLIGHTESVCHRKHPELRPVRRSGPSATPHVRQVFQPKGVPAVEESPPVVDPGLVVAMGVKEPETGICATDVVIPEIPPPSDNPVRGNSSPASVPILVLSNASRGAEADAQNFLTLVPQESSSPAKALSDNILSSNGDDRLLALSSRVGRERKREISSSLSPTRHHGHVRLVRANSEGRSGVTGDYNVVSCAEERIGGSAPNIRDLEEFNSALHRSGLFPVQFDGSAYTWTNGRMWQRLDRAVVNGVWLSDVEMTRVAHLQRGRSDHCPLLIRGGSTSTRRSSFRFLNVWQGHSSFQTTVKSAWAQTVSGVGMQKFFNKLQVVKRVLSRWNGRVFGNVSQRVQVAADNLLAKEILYDQNRDTLSRMAVHEARAVHSRELALECEFWRQKAAIKWIKEGDANTSFFHAAVKQKRSSNFISRIRGNGDCWFDSIDDIKLSAGDFFSSLFTADRAACSGSRPSIDLPKLTQEDNDMLLKSPSVEEVHKVICSLDPQSAAGPDGFGGGFYQSCWECIKDDFMDAVKDFFAGATMPRGFSSTTITLLPKKEGACEWKDFRPISLSNVSSKIISKILSTRINQFLPKLILEFQTGFIPGRGIQDNVLLAQELILDLDKKLRHPNVILKLDMEKAYDRVEWGFLLYMLREFGFKEGVVDLIFRLISNVWFSVLVNGELTSFFRSTRGVRQGDPLSSTLFLFVSEFLGRGLQQLFTNTPGFRFLSKGGLVSFLAFADDMVIFTRASSECLLAVSSLFRQYEILSGQKINLSKSRFLYSSKLPSEIITLIQQVTGFQEQSWPVKYLGVPLIRGRKKSIFFDGVFASVRAKLHHWSSRFLSAGGKLILLRHVLNSMPLYLLQVSKPPKGVFLRLGRLFNAFLWDGKDGRRIHWSSWEKLCFPVEEGGLGFRSLLDLEKAFAMKLWWRIRQKSSPWAIFMHRKYIGGQHPFLAAAGVGSATWKRVCSVRAIAEDNIRWRLGEGFIDLWHDRWFLDEPLSRQFDGAPPHCLVAEFYSSTGWNFQRLLQVLPRSVVNNISRIIVDPALKDELVWAPSADGTFTVSSAWELIRQRRNLSLVWRGIWCRVLAEFLPLDDQLRSRGFSLVSKCDCCGDSAESLHHIFLQGRLASAVWQHFFLACGIPWGSFSCVSSLLVVWFQSSGNGRLNHVRCAIPVVVLWFMWRSRNDARFGNIPSAYSKVIFDVNGWLVATGAARMLNRFQLEGDTDTYFAPYFRIKPGKSLRPKAISWMKPPRGSIKLNTDASVTNGLAKGGGVIRDFEGKMLGAFYKEFGECEVVHAEGLALLTGLQWCVETGLSGILVEVDSLALARLVTSQSVGKWPLCSVLSQIRLLLGKVNGAISHIYREANAVADSLAALSLESSWVTFQSHQQLPSRARSLIHLDAIGLGRWQAGGLHFRNADIFHLSSSSCPQNDFAFRSTHKVHGTPNLNPSGNFLPGFSQLSHPWTEPLCLLPTVIHLRLPVRTWEGYPYPPALNNFQESRASLPESFVLVA